MMLSFLVFGAPTLNPNGTINVVEGTNDSLSCSRSPDTSTTNIDATWTFGSTLLASSTDGVTYSYSNIMRNESGDYTIVHLHIVLELVCSLSQGVGQSPSMCNVSLLM